MLPSQLPTSNSQLPSPGVPRFSTIIVNWNTRDLLLQCVGSLLRHGQPGANQIIVVDNASSDDSVAALRAKHPEVEVIASQENLGFAKGNNLGLTHARGEYVCLVNSDIEVFDDVLGAMAAYMETHPEIGVLAPRLLNRDRTIQQGCWHYPTLLRTIAFSLGLNRFFPRIKALSIKPDLTGSEPHEVDTACGAFWMIRRRALDKIGGLDEAFWFYSEDVDYCRRFRDEGWQVVYYPAAEVVHYGGQSSGKAPVKYAIQMTRAKLQLWRKYSSPIGYALLWSAKACHHLIRTLGFGLKSLLPNASDNDRHQRHCHWECLKWMLTGS